MGWATVVSCDVACHVMCWSCHLVRCAGHVMSLDVLQSTTPVLLQHYPNTTLYYKVLLWLPSSAPVLLCTTKTCRCWLRVEEWLWGWKRWRQGEKTETCNNKCRGAGRSLNTAPQLVSSSVLKQAAREIDRCSWNTCWSISVFALPSVIHNNKSLHVKKSNE